MQPKKFEFEGNLAHEQLDSLIFIVQGNPIGTYGGEYLASSIQVNTSLTHLNTNYCSMEGTYDIWVSSLIMNITLYGLRINQGNDDQFAFRGELNQLTKTNKEISKIKHLDVSQKKFYLETEMPQLLSEACLSGHLGAVKYFLDCGVDVNFRPLKMKDIDKPILCAIHKGDLTITKCLISQGAKVTEDVVWKSQECENKDISILVRNLKDGLLDLSRGLQFVTVSSIVHKNITKLDLSENLLFEVTSPLMAKLSEMVELKELNLSSNYLSSLPDEIANLKLSSLNLSNNELETVPCSLSNMTTLKNLNLRGNRFAPYLADNLIKKSLPKVMEFLKENHEPVKTWKRLKILVVGKENVGKTCLIRRIQNKDYTRNMSTDGVQIQEVSLSSLKSKIDLCIYDLGGQEVFYPTHNFFLTDKSLYVVVFSFADELSVSRVEYWLMTIKAIGFIPCSILIVGTHKDMCSPSVVESTLDNMKRSFRMEYPSIKCFIAVSAKTSEGISELKNQIIKVASKESILRQKVPGAYIALDRIIMEKKNGKCLYLTWQEFRELAKSVNLYTETSCNECAEFLSKTGSIIWFNQSGLREYVILDPQLLSDVMACIISFKTNWKGGILYHKYLSIAWKQFPKRLHKSFIKLLIKFEILYPIRGNKHASIIPTVLPDEPDPSTYEYLLDHNLIHQLNPNLEKIERTYKFDFMPLGFFPRLLVKLYHSPKLLCHGAYAMGMVVTSASVVDDYVKKMNDNWSKQLVKLSLNQGFEQCYVQYHNFEQSAPILNITVYRTRENRENVFVRIIEIVENLISTNFVKYKDYVHRYAGYNNKSTLLTSVLDQIILGKDTMNIGGQHIELQAIAPDLYFLGIPRIENVNILEKVGEGGMGVVYLGTLDDGSKVAVKQLKMIASHNFLNKYMEFLHEAQIMNELNHPCLVKVMGICISPLQMVLEYVPGSDLFKIIHNKSITNSQFSVPLKLKIALDIAKGMNCLHSQTPIIVHRDLRSPNIFVQSFDLDQDVNAKVADFGLATRVLTNLDESLMTWQWHAPEVIATGKVSYDEKADVYSYGMILWEMFSRQYPFYEFKQYINETVETLSQQQLSDASLMETLHSLGWTIEGNKAKLFSYQKQNFIDAIVNHKLRPTIPEDTPFVIKHLISKAWSQQPDHRPSFVSIVEALQMITSVDINEISPKEADDILSLLTKQNASDKQYKDSIVDIIDQFIEAAEPDEIYIETYESSGDEDDAEEISSDVQTIRGPTRNTISFQSSYSFLTDGANKSNTLLQKTLLPVFGVPCRRMIQVEDWIWVGLRNGDMYEFNMSNITKPGEPLPKSLYKDICSIYAVKGDVWVGCEDSTITIWSSRRKKVKKTIKYASKVIVLSYEEIHASDTSQSKILSGDSSGYIMEWKNLNNVNKVLIEKNQPVTCMRHIDSTNQLWVGSFGKIYVYNTIDWSKVVELSVVGRISTLCQNEDIIYSATFDECFIYCISISDYTIVSKIELKSRISSLEIIVKDNIPLLWCGCLDGEIHIYNVLSRDSVLSLKGHSDIVHDMLKQENYSRMWSCSRDGTIKTWDY